MKKIIKVFFISLLLLSLVGNGLLSYYLYEKFKPTPSVMRFKFGQYNIVIYCERAQGVTGMEAIIDEGIYKIGNVELRSREELYLISLDGEITLSQLGGEAFVINSNGELLYQFVKSEKENSETVFVTPSGKKYHSDTSCAGGTAFETDLKTAELFGRKSCSICLS